MTTIGYTTTEELARLLKVTPTADQQAQLERVLTASYVEIVSEVGDTTEVPLTTDEENLAAEVQLERGREHWQQAEAPMEVVGLGDDVAIYTPRDSWDRHAKKLAPLKREWGLA